MDGQNQTAQRAATTLAPTAPIRTSFRIGPRVFRAKIIAPLISELQHPFCLTRCLSAALTGWTPSDGIYVVLVHGGD